METSTNYATGAPSSSAKTTFESNSLSSMALLWRKRLLKQDERFVGRRRSNLKHHLEHLEVVGLSRSGRWLLGSFSGGLDTTDA